MALDLNFLRDCTPIKNPRTCREYDSHCDYPIRLLKDKKLPFDLLVPYHNRICLGIPAKCDRDSKDVNNKGKEN